MAIKRRYHCRSCGADFPAWLPAAKRPDGAMVLQHLSAMHPDQVGPYRRRMATECISAVVVEAYAVVEGEG